MNQVLKVDPSKKWSGPTRPYDLVKEIVVAIVVKRNKLFNMVGVNVH